MQYCSSPYCTLLSLPDTSTTGCHFPFGSASSFFLTLFLHSSSLAVLTPTDLGEFILKCQFFLPFNAVHGVLKARMLKWLAISFSNGPPLSDFSTMTCPSWVALHSMAHSSIELHKPLYHHKAVIPEGEFIIYLLLNITKLIFYFMDPTSVALRECLFW